MRVFDCLALRPALPIHRVGLAQMITVTGVQRPVPRFDDAWIMVGVGARRIVLQAALPLPGLAFIVGHLNGEAVAAFFRVVADEEPSAIFQRDDFSAGAGVGELAVARGGP